MNLQHLKYAVEVAQAGSMTRAAENLFTSQPSLSRAIRELEATLGITIFKRTSKGLSPTQEGSEFLDFAKKIIAQVDEVESMYRAGRANSPRFSLSAPDGGYISLAFRAMAEKLSHGMEMSLFRADSASTLENVISGDCRLGILRSRAAHRQYNSDMLTEKGLVAQATFDFTPVVVISSRHPLAEKAQLEREELEPYPQVCPTEQDNMFAQQSADKLHSGGQLRISAGAAELIGSSGRLFMWSCPLPEETLARFDLVQLPCPTPDSMCEDMLVTRADYKLTDLDRLFLDELKKAAEALGGTSV